MNDMKTHTMLSLLLMCSWAMAESATTSPAITSPPKGIESITRPSEDIMLAFVQPGLVANVLIKEGQMAKAGDVIIQLDDSAEQAQLEQLRLEAEDKIRIKASEAELAQSHVDLKKMELANLRGGATDLELEHAKLEVLINELKLELSKFNQEQALRKHNETLLLVERMKLKSPIDGLVERVALDAGEAAERLERVVRVVKIDPLWMDVPVSLEVAREKLETGQPAEVYFPSVAGRWTLLEGKIILKATVADAASDTLNVRVEVPNPSNRPAGERVIVSFPALAK